MSTSDGDAELERLLGEARAGTQPAAGASERIRASLEQRLAAPPVSRVKWLSLGAGVVGLVALGVWLTRSAPPAPSVAPRPAPSHVVSTAPVEPPAPSVAVPAPSEAALQPAPSVRRIVAAAAPSADPSDELPLLAAMQAALRASNAAEALSLAAEHGRRFPKSQLTPEREGVRAIARCWQMEPPQRPAVRDDFLARFGRSPYAARVRDACAP